LFYSLSLNLLTSGLYQSLQTVTEKTQESCTKSDSRLRLFQFQLTLAIRRVATDLRAISSRPRPVRPTPVSLHRDTQRRLEQRVMAATEPVKRFTPQEIVAQLDSKFEKARESGDLLFFPSTANKHRDVGVDVRVLLI